MSDRCVQAPIVLVHGILGFASLRIRGKTLGEYFRGVRQALQTAGNAVPEPPRLNPAGRIAERANDLKRYLETAPGVAGRRVHLIAHSMGGLDSRYLISRLESADRVLSLTTIGTPHRGTAFADWGTAAARPVVDALHRSGINLHGFRDLTTAACEAFNQETLDAPAVRYYSVAGQFQPTLFDLLKVPHDILLKAEGPNDGLVSVASARHGRFLGVWPGNHFRLINWASNFLTPPSELEDATMVENYLSLVRALADDGF